MTSVIQPSFSKGAISPALYGRVDTAIYGTAVRVARNIIIRITGGAESRPGTRYIGPVKDHSYAPKLIPFEFKTQDTYMLEFGDFYMRVIRNDGNVIESSEYAITGATQANPVVITAPGHDYVNGMTVRIQNVGGMTEINDRDFIVANADTVAGTFELSGEDGTGHTAYTSGGTATQLINITNATQANPIVLTTTQHGYNDGDEIVIENVVGMTQLNNNRYIVKNPTLTTFELADQVTGANIDSTGFGAYVSGGNCGRIYEIVTPYSKDDVFQLVYTQSADVMTFTHDEYPIQELSRFDHDDWVLQEPVFGPEIAFPTGIQVTVNTTGTETDRYQVTAIAVDTGEESLPGLSNNVRTITGATQADPVVITTSAAHGFLDGDEVYIADIVGMTELNERRFIVRNPTATTYELQDEDGTQYSAYVSGGTCAQTFFRVTNSNTTRDNTISWTATPNAERYAVYRFEGGTFGLIGETEALSFEDSNFDPDTSESPPKARDPFSGTNDKPGAVGYFEQRRVFGGSLDKPDTSEYSQVGNTSNFNKSTPLRPDDAITATLTSRQVNQIRHYVPGNDLIQLTSGSEWRINSGPDQKFSFDTIKQKPQTTWGSSYRQPITIGNVIMFIGDDESSVRSLNYNLQIDGYRSSNMALLSGHFLRGHTLKDWSYGSRPESRIYMCRDDGIALNMIFEQDEEVLGWSHWDTSGKFESTAALRGGGRFGEDSVYFVARRTVDGNVVRYVEVWRQSYFPAVEDCFYVDSGLSLDNPVAITDISLTNPVVITAPNHNFSNDDEVDVSDVVWVPDVNDQGTETEPDQANGYRYVVKNATTNTFEIYSIDDGTSIDGTGWNAYVEGGNVRKAVDTIDGFEHLRGRTIIALCDGNVVRDLAVSGQGVVQLPRKFSRVHGGLPYIADLELLDVEISGGGDETIQDRQVVIPKVTVRFERSRSLLIGGDEKTLTEMKQREFEKMGQPTALLTGDKEITLTSKWNSNGRLLLRQINPLPMNILAVIPTVITGKIPDGGSA